MIECPKSFTFLRFKTSNTVFTTTNHYVLFTIHNLPDAARHILHNYRRR